MKKRGNIKKEVKRIKKTKVSTVNKRKNKNQPDLWKEIRSNLKPIGKAYNKFREKRRIVKQKEEERRLKEEEKQRIREEEALRLQEHEERKFQKEQKVKEEEERRLKAQENKRLEEKRVKDEWEERIKQEQIYQERLLKGEEERIKQIKRVNELREEERKLKEERNSKIDPILDEELRFKEEKRLELEQRLKEKEERLKEKEQRLKEEEQKLKEEEKINLKTPEKTDAEKEEKRLNGTVKWFSDAKGYGFIKTEGKEKDIFVHLSAVKNSGLEYLKEGELLTFEIDYSDKGPSAINLQKTITSEEPRSHLKVVK